MKINNENLLQTTGLNFETMEDAIFYLQNHLEWLERHNKNYNRDQYHKILDCLEIIKNIEIE